jgi:hypothetical protein
MVGAFVEWDLNATRSRFADIFVNNTSRLAEMAGGFVTNANDNPQCVGNAVALLAANDYIECRVYQNSGGALNVFLESDLGPDMWAYLVGV